MKIRRCAFLLLEPRERLQFDLATLFGGQTALRVHLECLALAAHLDEPVAISRTQRDILLGVGESTWIDHADACVGHDIADIAALLEAGLLLEDSQPASPARQRDERMRASFWHPLSAVYHAHARWRGQDTGHDPHQKDFRSVADMVAAYGPPPPAEHCQRDTGDVIALPDPRPSGFEALLRSRRTCRNFDPQHRLGAGQLATVLHRAFAAQARTEIAPGATVFTKLVPSGGSLHPIEAYVLVQRVENVPTGLYHYRAGSHQLQHLASHDASTARNLALTMVAGQAYFADAPAMIVLVARFARNFWKYRRHVKALRAIHLDAGHLSQMVYLAATELDLAAFVTAAINEHDIGDALGVDTLELGPVAVCGIGIRDRSGTVVELNSLPVLADPGAAKSA